MIGDSLVGQNDFSMVATLNHYNYSSVTVIDAHINGSGLIGPVVYTAPNGTVTNFPSALEWVKYNVGLHPTADTVVMEYVGTCAICDQWFRDSVTYGSDAFYAKWIANGKAIIDWLKSQGKTVFWVESPQVGSAAWIWALCSRPALPGGCPSIDGVTLAPYAGTPKVDWWQALNDTNGNVQQYLYYNGAQHTVRYDDLVHIQVDGSVRTSTWSVSTLGQYWTSSLQAAELCQHNCSNHGNHLVEAGDPVVDGGMQGPP